MLVEVLRIDGSRECVLKPIPVSWGQPAANDSSFIQYGRHRMNPKHFHTPVSTRLRCPVCHQPVYSRGGIHPQCAMRQSEPALHEPEEPVEIAAGEEKVAIAVATATIPKIKSPKVRPATMPVGVKAGR